MGLCFGWGNDGCWLREVLRFVDRGCAFPVVMCYWCDSFDVWRPDTIPLDIRPLSQVHSLDAKEGLEKFDLYVLYSVVMAFFLE
jgi:hypothetical protein